MSSTRPSLKLDEQSFQELLAAAYTIQEHNDRRKQQKNSEQKFCGYCGTQMPAAGGVCPHCGADAQGFRSGERLQRNWASLWLMSQKLSGEANFAAVEESAGNAPEKIAEADRTALSGIIHTPISEDETALEAQAEIDGEALPETVVEAEETEPSVGSELVPQFEAPLVEVPAEETAAPTPAVAGWGWKDTAFWNLRLTLRFHRADLYMVVAIGVAAIALLWVALAPPQGRIPASSLRADNRPRVHLTAFERALIQLGVAEAPDPPAYHGDPKVQVWVDPHTALYYCPGDEQFGKTADGHLTTQREAQMDRFEPAERAACE